MKQNNVVISQEIKKVLAELQHPQGPAKMYDVALRHLFDMVLYNQDLIGLSDRDAITTLKVLDMIREDLKTLSLSKDPNDHYCKFEDDEEDEYLQDDEEDEDEDEEDPEDEDQEDESESDSEGSGR